MMVVSQVKEKGYLTEQEASSKQKQEDAFSKHLLLNNESHYNRILWILKIYVGSKKD